MFKLLILSSMLMVAAAYPSFQLLSFPSDETISLTSFLQPEQPPNTITAASSEESVEAPASSPETPTPTQESPEPTEAAATAEPTDSSAALQAADLTSTSLTPSSLGSLSIQHQLPIQHQLLPPETISLPISITTSPGLRTILAPETIRIHEPTVAKIGELVQKIPTAVSHQSQTVVHKHAEVVTPIVAPAIRTITSQVVRAYHTPLVYAAHAPVIKFIQH